MLYMVISLPCCARLEEEDVLWMRCWTVRYTATVISASAQPAQPDEA